MKEIYSYTIPFSEVGLRLEQISAFMGLGPIPDPPFDQMIETSLNLLSKSKAITGGFRIGTVDGLSAREGKVKVNGTVLGIGTMIASFLRNSEYVALFTCTAGMEVEHFSDRFKQEDDFVLSYVMDATGSMLVEGAMDLVQDRLKEMVGLKGFSITNRYSPGYCDWKVADQQNLFSLLPWNFCGVSLNRSCLMSPVKSVSGIIGIGKSVKHLDYICDRCKNATCIYRKKEMYLKN
ncbi:MAG: vitamin B12 dependent-methionine synthase activation domain-containing protein [Bacteroidota bacterium]